MAPVRRFLGWQAGFLERAAEWILEAAGPAQDLGEWVLVLPGARAGRRLEELLARRAMASWVPPRCVTPGALPLVLAGSRPRLAPQSGRELAWTRAARELAPDERAALTRREPADARAWRLLARRLLRWDETLAREGLEPAEVARLVDAPFSEQERRRWEALAAARARFEAALATAGWMDPARAAGRVAASGLEDLQVVLVAPAELAPPQRALLLALARPAVSLVCAPESLEGDFDGWGTPRTEVWSRRDTGLTPGAWRVCQDSADVARETAAWLADVAAQRATSPDEVSLGVLREELVHPLARELGLAGVSARHGAGVPVERLAPLQLLEGIARWLASRAFADLGALLRHPEAELAVRPAIDPLDPISLCDAYEREHLPSGCAGPWLGARAGDVQRLVGAVAGWLGALAGEGARSLADWSGELRRFLARTYATLEEDPARESQWMGVQALRALAEALAELEEVSASPFAEAATAAEALELLLERLRGERAAPPPRAGAVEMLGWLELFLDEAPHVLVAGFDEGAVPQMPPADSSLPRSLTARLRIRGEEARVARDAYVAAALLASRPGARFLSTRRDSRGDPLRPSRLVFHGPGDEAPARALRFFGKEESERAREAPRDGRPYVPPLEARPAPEVLRVTDFKAYLDSPYRFYLERIEKLATVEAFEPELDALAFGNLAHAVLQEFGAGDGAASEDAGEIRARLDRALEARVAATYGREPLPAVRLQVEQLRHRLAGFARWQAEQAREGWRIAHVEREFRAPLDVDGVAVTLVGRIDRIDRHESGQWRILDYKTGEDVDPPGKALRRDGTWRDLQLPLYRELTRELWGREEPRLGYVVLSKDSDKVSAPMAPWIPAQLDGALEAAREVVRRIRKGELADLGSLGRGAERQPVLAALAGCGLLELADEDDGEESE